MKLINAISKKGSPYRSLDFIYIDSNHYFRYVAEDLFEWTKKVRRRGIIAGHDYRHINYDGDRPNHVKVVVDAFTKAYCINNWYTFGNDTAISYMFFKVW